MAIINRFIVSEGNVEDVSVLWVAKIPLFSLKGKADFLEREYEFLQYIYCTKPVDGSD